ncbi:phospho-2-dehydro-3-deoxyheptonate aldolase AroG [Gottschalkia acidurici 9a]|uniref:Phospho-2-dehydro-3-deoxyheptonate aldolase n=1 Tax=Gottschalkia acidurici (strain ATCC 7906 / DSM 604 / BCRC 14475 / CIP 104303 / KCTC 5404 / NCIMB 10678 / 9a) TaxID=1128398 RepID=K0B0U0_GOTA9|nr:3-deoxy-7-phosphoheptulonate synthase [Gottschalkia acidurici]AFS78535.1 phospho-2-dehydro-3-deoxyheptonate aldolase AroG [Gottschalkia acidurici 9a]
MSFKYINKIPSPEEIINAIPLEKSLVDIKSKRDKEIREVFEGKSNKFILVIGPCSADFEDSVCEYVNKLSLVQDKVKDKILMIPRIYTNKPRTTGEGYKGMMHQPDPNEKPNVTEGIKSIRKIHIRAIKESGLTSADEMLYPENYPYVADLLSYVAIGARSVENQQHRLTVSGMDIPAGMKNPTSGDISVMFNSIKAAQISHNFIYNGYEVETSGNLLAHAILRGAVNQHGDCIPNYHYENLALVAEEYEKRGYINPAIIIDTNHSNSMKKFDEQTRIASEVIHSKLHSPALNKLVKGLMIESYLVDGRQDSPDVYGKSITDPCLGWEKTEKLIYDIAEKL